MGTTRYTGLSSAPEAPPSSSAQAILSERRSYAPVDAAKTARHAGAAKPKPAGRQPVSIVMITYNRCDEVLRSLEKLLELPERPHVVVVDNGSADGTADSIARRFHGVEVVQLVHNIGAAARNVGVARAETPYVAFCDDDTWWESGSLAEAARLFEAHSRLAIVTARLIDEPAGREAAICRVLEGSPIPAEPGMPGRPLLGFLAGASVVRKAAFLQAGGFHPRFFIGGEEELLALDLVTRGWWICYVPQLVAHHQPSPRRNTALRRCHTRRNALWVSWLRRPAVRAWADAFRAARAGLSSRNELISLVEAVAGLPWVLRERRVVPPRVEQSLRILESAGRSAQGVAACGPGVATTAQAAPTQV